MKEKRIKEEKRKLKDLRKELEERLKNIIPDSVKENADKVVSLEERCNEEELTIGEAKNIIEALLFSSSKPLSIRELCKILRPLSQAEINKQIKELKNEYELSNKSFRLREIAGGFEISTLEKYSKWIKKLEKEKRAKQASMAALETLSILAYKQPVTRVEVEEIRGVDASGVISTLMEKGFIKIVGRKEIPGRPLMYGTTKKFLEYFGLKSLKDLPDIKEIKSLVEDTIKKEEVLRKEKDVTVAQIENTSFTVDKEKTKELAEKYEEISKQISDVKVLSANQVSKIVEVQTDNLVTQ